MKVLYPGSFDPLTYGHLDLINRGLDLFGEVIVAVIENPNKTHSFSLETRIKQISEATKNHRNITITSFEGLTVRFAKQNKAKLILRGLRAMSDFEYELQIAHTNRSLDESLETIFLATQAKHSFLSSSVVKEVAKFGGNTDHMVPDIVARDLSHYFNSN